MPTERRIFRISTALHKRQNDLILALDGVHDPHNLSAVIRTADATGIGKILWLQDFSQRKSINPDVSLGTERWVNLEITEDLTSRLKIYKQKKYQIIATHLASKAVDFRKIDWSLPSIVVLGNEHRGCSEKTLEIADENIFLPMNGFVQSLNISVAAAVIMYEIQRQRELKGMYNKTAAKPEVEALYNQWSLKDDFFKLDSFYNKPDCPIPEPEFPLNERVPKTKKHQKN